MVLFNKILKKRSICYNHQQQLLWCHPKMDRLVIVAIILETIVLNKMCLVLLVTAFKVGFPKISKLLLPYYYIQQFTVTISNTHFLYSFAQLLHSVVYSSYSTNHSALYTKSRSSSSWRHGHFKYCSPLSEGNPSHNYDHFRFSPNLTLNDLQPS